MFSLRYKSKINSASVTAVAAELNLHPVTTEILFGRGFDSVPKINAYLTAADAPLHSPLLIGGMQAAAARVSRAIDCGENVVIYSDYDADGVCSAAMLYKFFVRRGLQPSVYIPNRLSEGYGLHIDAIEKIAEEFCPDLIITCDCGISAAEEVEYVMDLGIEIIVTDHHEVPEKIPQCITVNPKLSAEYPCRDLCGAGVVLKLIEAAGGDADDYIDICAVATVADLVALTDENRTITARGLLKLNNAPSSGLAALVKSLKLTEPVSSGDIAYRIAPRINAAGRMGDAMLALQLLLSEDEQEAELIVAKLESDNERRRVLCDSVYESAIAALDSCDLSDSPAIVLQSTEWEKGIVGIVCARLAGEFRRPVFLLTKSGNSYKATARSIEGINMYELLTAHAHLLEEFGGHSQAAGFSIKANKINEFAASVNAYLRENFDRELFLPSGVYDAEIDIADITLELARELELLEPTGTGNPRPVFLLESGALNTIRMKNREHLTVVDPSGRTMVAFNFAQYNDILRLNQSKRLLAEISVNKFNRTESLRINIKDISAGTLRVCDKNIADCRYIGQLAYPQKKAAFCRYSDLGEVLGGRLYGTLVLADTFESYTDFVGKIPDGYFFLHEMSVNASANNYNRIILSPRLSERLGHYERVILLDPPLSESYLAYLKGLTGARIFVPQADIPALPIDCGREVFGLYYKIIAMCGDVAGADFYEYAEEVGRRHDIALAQLLFSIMVFRELGIVRITKSPYSVRINKSIKSELMNSTIYRLVSEGALCKV